MHHNTITVRQIQQAGKKILLGYSRIIDGRGNTVGYFSPTPFDSGFTDDDREILINIFNLSSKK